MYYLQCVRGKAPLAVLAPDHPLAARVHPVRLEPVPLDARAALVVAVHRLKSAAQLMVVDGRARKVPLAVLAADEALLARVQHVVLHEEAGNLGAARVEAGDGVLLTGVEVSF